MNSSTAGKLGYLKSKSKLEQRIKKFQEDYYNNPKYCVQCNCVIPYAKRKNTFCTHKCAATFNAPSRREKNGKIGRPCKECGCKANGYNTYCDICIQNNKHRHPRKNIKECETDKTRRKFLIKTRGHKCEICQLSEWNKRPIPLQLDHIDGDYMNNIEENLRILCPNCHAQTDTYCGKNMSKGKGRYYRKHNIPLKK